MTKELVERLYEKAASADRVQHARLGARVDEPSQGFSAEGNLMRMAAAAISSAESELATLRARVARLEHAAWFARDHLSYMMSGPFRTGVEVSLIAKIDAALTEEPKT